MEEICVGDTVRVTAEGVVALVSDGALTIMVGGEPFNVIQSHHKYEVGVEVIEKKS